MGDRTAKRPQSRLLDSGTNEMEIAEIIVGEQSFGINVAKVQQIIQSGNTDITHLPSSHPSLLGTFLFRDRSIPLIDLKHALYREFISSDQNPIILVAEFNRTILGFLINGAERFHRFSWDDLQPISSFLRNNSAHITGTLTVEGTDILILDIEQLTAEILPNVAFRESSNALQREDLREMRSRVTVLYAEDSSFVRGSVVRELKKHGYTNLIEADNGKTALTHIHSLRLATDKENIPLTDRLHAVLTDIEMPQMDGLTLCRKLKKDMNQKNIPVIVVSSLISDQMRRKCREVGVDKVLSKPQVEDIVTVLDCLIFGVS
ncbi:MAG: chemotaxis protein [bacterium]